MIVLSPCPFLCYNHSSKYSLELSLDSDCNSVWHNECEMQWNRELCSISVYFLNPLLLVFF